MKSKKHNGIIICALFLILSGLLSGCGGEEKEKVTLVIKTPVYQLDGVPDSEVRDTYTFLSKAAEEFAGQYEKAEVTVSVTQFEAENEQEEVAGCYDTDKAADVLFGLYFNIKNNVYTGRVVPLNDIISGDIRVDIDEKYWRDSTIQGKVFLMPYIQSQNVLAYNKDLFRQAGLEEFISDGTAIQSWSMEEWETVLDTLSKNLPENTYPMMMYAADNQGDTHIMTLLQSCNGSFFDENNRVACNTPAVREAMEKLRDYNEKGYFPPNAETMVMMDNYRLFANNQLAIYCCNTSVEVLLHEKNIDYGLVNFPSEDGRGLNSTFLSGFQVFDNGDEATLQAAKDFVKYLYESDWLDYSAGGIPVSNEVMDKYRALLEDKQKYMDNQAETIDIDGGNPNWTGVREVFHTHIADLFYGEKDVGEIAKEIDEDSNAAIEEGYKDIRLHE